MRIQIVSDLHFHHYGYLTDRVQSFPKETQTDADVLIIAGDAVEWSNKRYRWSIDRLTEIAVRYPNTVYVLGNHDHWEADFETAKINAMDAAKVIPHFHLLRTGKPVTINGQRFLGDTMWFPKPEDPWRYADHHFIREYDFEGEADRDHREFVKYLQDELKPDDIVVTHHAPSAKSIAECWRGSPLNPYFCADHVEQDVIEPLQPKLWVHGHMHMCFDYKIGNTRVICNPRGYPDEEGNRFDPKLVVEV